jgi:hypothetical protein
LLEKNCCAVLTQNRDEKFNETGIFNKEESRQKGEVSYLENIFLGFTRKYFVKELIPPGEVKRDPRGDCTRIPLIGDNNYLKGGDYGS